MDVLNLDLGSENTLIYWKLFLNFLDKRIFSFFSMETLDDMRLGFSALNEKYLPHTILHKTYLLTHKLSDFFSSKKTGNHMHFRYYFNRIKYNILKLFFANIFNVWNCFLKLDRGLKPRTVAYSQPVYCLILTKEKDF